MHDNQIIFLARARGPLVHSRQASEQHRSGTGRAQKLTSGCAVLGCCARSAPRSFVGAPELPNERRAAVRGAPRHSLLCCDFSRTRSRPRHIPQNLFPENRVIDVLCLYVRRARDIFICPG